jgi:hypothetical protein
VKTVFWLKLAAAKSRYGRWEFRGAPKAFVGKPDIGRDEIAVKMNVEIPDGYFEDPQLTIEMKIPENKSAMNFDVDTAKLGKAISQQIGMKVFVSIPTIEAQP